MRTKILGLGPHGRALQTLVMTCFSWRLETMRTTGGCHMPVVPSWHSVKSGQDLARILPGALASIRRNLCGMPDEVCKIQNVCKVRRLSQSSKNRKLTAPQAENCAKTRTCTGRTDIWFSAQSRRGRHLDCRLFAFSSRAKPQRRKGRMSHSALRLGASETAHATVIPDDTKGDRQPFAGTARRVLQMVLPFLAVHIATLTAGLQRPVDGA